ncbi:sensor histidine kinase [Nonomuraea zeae]|uniref:Sensor histidine kinase n=1 Tax=Nonomuraea zeae TaxID=1642303 RepID=A0A5S4GWB9_9ACTN|nr:sensor histidine kinase [Nonomuraea zeae]TMR37187.1 sensor histidine kinase [Nonomuraea zeae]
MSPAHADDGSETRREEPAGSSAVERVWDLRNLTRSLIMLAATGWAVLYFAAQHPPPWQTALAVAGAVAVSALGVSGRVLAQRGSPRFPKVYAVLVVAALALEVWGGWPWAAAVTWVTTACGWSRLPRAGAHIAGVSVVAGAIAVGHGLEVGPAAALTAFVVLPGVFAVQTRRTSDLVEELRETRRELARLAVVEERNRIARDLHDLVGHSLSVVVVKTELARRLVPAAPERAVAELDDVEGVVRRALAEIRQAVTDYRRPTLAAEIAGAESAARSAEIECTVLMPDDWDLPVPVESLLAWTVREGVTNVLRHSAATHCWITLRQDERTVSVEIRDDGQGPADPGNVPDSGPGSDSGSLGSGPGGGAGGGAGGNGLTGLSERAAALGGRIEVGRPAEGGFRLAVRIPLEA